MEAAAEEEEMVVGDRTLRKASLYFLYIEVRFLVAMDGEEVGFMDLEVGIRVKKKRKKKKVEGSGERERDSESVTRRLGEP